MSDAFLQARREHLRLAVDRDLHFCSKHRHLVVDADGCATCAREWVTEHGDAAARWALAELDSLIASVNRGDYDFSEGAYDQGVKDGYAEARRGGDL